MDRYYPHDSIAALATPWGESALAVIRVSGAETLELLSPLFSGKVAASLGETRGFTLRQGLLKNSRTGKPIDQVLIAVYKAPKSYTGEASAEIFCHGNPSIIRSILDTLQDRGFRSAGPGEFTLRAFLNGRMDLTEAEAVNEIVRSRTDRAAALALSRLSGSIEREVGAVKESVAGILAAVEVHLDYPEEDLDGTVVPGAQGPDELLHGAVQGLERLLESYGIGKIMQEGINVVLAGRTNSGKSTLFNRFLGQDRAIVSAVHGTTRDYLEGLVAVKGIPVKLHDTAGYRFPESDSGEGVPGVEEIEREGLRRTDRIIQDAHFIFYLVDAQTGIDPLDRSFFQGFEGDNRLIRVWNKIDLDCAACPPGFVPVSAREGQGLAALADKIAAGVFDGNTPLEAETAVIDSTRQKQLLEQALQALVRFREGLELKLPLDVLAVELKEALDSLGQITGEVTSQEILNKIFSSFCVGK